MKTKEIQWAGGAITGADNKAFTIWTHPDPDPWPAHLIFERRGPDTGDRVDFQRFPAGGESGRSYQTLASWYDEEKGCLVSSTHLLTYKVPNQYVEASNPPKPGEIRVSFPVWEDGEWIEVEFVKVHPFRRS